MNLAEIMLRGVKAVAGKVTIDRIMMVLVYSLVTALAIGTVGLMIHSCGKVKTTAQELQKAEEAIKLRDVQISAFEASNKRLETTLSEELKASAVLREVLKDAERRIKTATGKAPEVIEVIRYVTIPGHASGVAPPGREALVARGDTLQIRGTSLKLETKAGNHVVTGVASCWRLQPTPETMLYEGPIDMGSVKAVEKEKPSAVAATRRWGFGPVGTIDTSGNWAVGPQVSYRIWRVDLNLGMTFPDQRTIGSVLVRP